MAFFFWNGFYFSNGVCLFLSRMPWLIFPNKYLITQRSRRSPCLSGRSLCPAISWMGDVWHSLWVKPARWEKVKHSLKAQAWATSHTHIHTHTPWISLEWCRGVPQKIDTSHVTLRATRMENSHSGLTLENHIGYLYTWSLRLKAISKPP